MSWYRKYRPAKISDLSISSVKEIFETMLLQGKIPQVMLFAGPKGTGKTSSARIIAGILNDPQNAAIIDHLFFAKEKPKENQLKEADQETEMLRRIHAGSSFVVQEMDAASNRGIDDIRALKERLSIPPQDGKMSVYILDEAHMLTKEAFNALLKMLEETPPHVAFILATTELHKIPATVVSRCSIVHFRKASQNELLLVLQKIVKSEELKIEDGVLELVAQSADGSFRDAIKLLELLGNTEEKISLELAKNRLSAIGESSIKELLDSLLEKDEKKLLNLFSDLRNRQVDEKFLFKSLLEYLHEQLLTSLGLNKENAKLSYQVSHFLLKELSSLELVTNLPVPLLSLEIKFLELIFRSKEKGGGQTPKESVKPARNVLHDDVGGENSLPLDLSNSNFKSDSLTPVIKGDSQRLLSAWSSFLGAVEKKQAVIAMLLRSSKPIKAQNGSLSIEVYYPFHKEKLEDINTINMLRDCSISLAGGLVDLEFILSDKQLPNVVKVSQKDENVLLELAEEILV